jgi:ABC-type amino acid transport substrate-binding protein
MIAKWKGMAVFIITIVMIICIRLMMGDRLGVSSGYTVALVTGATYKPKAWNLPKVKDFKYFPDVNRVLREVAQGRADAGIVDRLTGLNLIKVNQYRNLIVTGDLAQTEALKITFNREDRTLRQTINRALKEIIHNGTYARISRKYFDCDILQGMELRAEGRKEPAAADGSWRRVQKMGVINFVMKGDNPPLYYYNDQRELSGFEVDLAEAICNHLGLKFVPNFINEDGAVEGLRARYFDGIWGPVKIAEEQLKDVDFSEPYLITGQQLIVRDSFMITGPEFFK